MMRRRRAAAVAQNSLDGCFVASPSSRERRIQGWKAQPSAPRFLSTHPAAYNSSPPSDI